MLQDFISRCFRIIQTIEAWLLSSAIIGIALLTILNVFTRAVLDFSLAFAEEVSQFLIILVCFVGLSYAASRGRHIRMTALYDQLSGQWKKSAMILISGFTAVLMFLLAWFSIRYISTVQSLGTVSPVLQIPYYLVYLTVPLGLVLAGIQYTLAVVRNFTEPDVYLSFQQKDEYVEFEYGTEQVQQPEVEPPSATTPDTRATEGTPEREGAKTSGDA